METHESDPTAPSPGDPWEAVSDELGRLKHLLQSAYRDVADDQGPSEEEVKAAIATLAAAWDRIAESLSMALRDPEVRDQIKNASSSIATALGATISEFGAELRKTESWEASPTAEEA